MSKKSKNVKLTETLKIKIRTEFVQGYNDDNGQRMLYTLDELIKKHNVAKSTMYRVSQKENWKLQREEFNQEYLSKLDAERTKNMTAESKKMDNQSINLAKALYSTIGAIIRNNSNLIAEGKKGIPPSQVNSLANAALTAQRLAKLALGEPTENINANIKENDSFREAMELLDTVAERRRESNDSSIH
jgi:hypothetical protein